jgi:import inner membrane translocase subunit TIM23
MTSRKNYDILSPDFGEQIAFTTGMAYITGFFLGFTRGIMKGYRKSNRLPMRLKISNFLNAIGTETSRGANAFGSVGMLYFFTGKILKFCLEDPLDYFGTTTKNMICGTLTGAIYKSTLGLRPTMFGCVLGAGLGFSISLLIDWGNKKGYIGFRMKY